MKESAVMTTKWQDLFERYCSVCQQVFASRACLDRHRRTVHSSLATSVHTTGVIMPPRTAPFARSFPLSSDSRTNAYTPYNKQIRPHVETVKRTEEVVLDEDEDDNVLLVVTGALISNVETELHGLSDEQLAELRPLVPLRPLSEQERARVNGILASAAHGRAQDERLSRVFCVRDLLTLQTGVWLNDSVIDLYAQHVCRLYWESMRRSRSVDTGRVAACYSLFFFEQWKRGGYAKVRRWSRNFRAVTKNMFELRALCLPVADGGHFYLLVVDFLERKIYYLDSLYTSESRREYAERRMDQVFAFIQEEHRVLYGGREQDPNEWELVFWTNTPHQRGTVDCGVFVCAMIHQLMEHYWQSRPGVPKTWGVSQDDIPQLRAHLARTLLAYG